MITHPPAFPSVVAANLRLRLKCATAFLSLCLAPLALAQSQPTWTNVAHNLPAASAFSGVAAGNGVIVVTGTNLVSGSVPVAFSTDGTTWTSSSITPPFAADGFNRVRFLNGRFIVAAYGTRGTGANTVRTGSYYTSTDGRTWTPNEVAANVAFLHAEIEFGNGRYIIVGGNGFLFGSTDLSNWTPLTSNVTGIFSYQDVAFGNGRWFITTNGGGTVATSTDGQNFTSVSGLAGAPGGYRVEYGNGVWFFYSQLNNAVSNDNGTTFIPVTRTNTTPGGTGTIRFVNGRFLSPGFVGVPFQASLDGRTWTNFGAYPAVTSIFTATYDFAFGAGRYVTAGSITPSIAQLANPTPVIFTLAEADAPSTPVPPTITTAPLATAAVLGRPATFSVAATGTGNTYQWLKDNAVIPGATAATYTIAAVTAASAGNYAVRITNALGTATSTPVALTIVAASNSGRLVNMSIRTAAGTGDDTLIVGLGIGGANTAGAKPILLRGVGPTLGAFGVGGTLADSVLTVFRGQTQVAQNDDWTGSFNFASVGAFALSGNPVRDAAIYDPALASGSYSIQITGKNNATGIALAAIYDATPSDAFSAATPRLVNVSARTQVGTGDNVLIAGFSIGGSTALRVLIRAVGPTLGAFGVGDTLADPRLQIFRGQTQIADNDNWAAADAATFAPVGAFNLQAGSRDAVLVLSLQPGTYSAQVSGVNNTTGVALVEVYELP